MSTLLTKLRALTKDSLHALDDYFSLTKSRFQPSDLSIFHQFAPPPSGGGHQFLRALWHEAKSRGLKVENNSISPTTRACLFNSFNFDERRLRRMRRNSILYVHRVDGPIDVYRGRNEGIDQKIWQINHDFADKTIFQSKYSLQEHLLLGLEFKEPSVIINAADPLIFHHIGRISFSRERKIRLIASSWSDNIHKGAPIYQWLDEHLDWSQFEFTFVGRTRIKYKNIQMVDAVPSSVLANYLRQHDIYITASRNDPCSNSLIEALNCGLPALYLNSGGHPELVGEAGLGYESAEEIPALLQQIIDGYSTYQSHIQIPTIEEVATCYLEILSLV